MNKGTEHPVWSVYDEFRTARFNTLCYKSRLIRLKRTSFWVELVLATSVSSGVAGLWFWETTTGDIIWKALATIAAFLSVIKAVYKLSDRIQKINKSYTSWLLLDSALQKLAIMIGQDGKYDDVMKNRFLTLLDTKATIIESEPSEDIDEKLRKICYEKVNKELPVDKFYVPEE